ncbi:MAG: MFS transporter [Sedimentisphaerales bacterium]|nr:MFS transporter [Sedimentisphaerales bacterium]
MPNRADLHVDPPPPDRSWWFGELSRPTRLGLGREFVATLPLAAPMSVIGMGFCGFVGRKALGMPDTLLACLMASNFLGFLLAGPLIGYFQSVRKILALRRILLAVSLLLVTILLTPYAQKWAPLLFLGQIFLAQIGIALTLPLRTSIWRYNYPTHIRGRIVVIISLSLTLGISGIIFLFTTIMDHWRISYAWMYGISGISGIASCLLFGRVRIRQERTTLRRQAGAARQIPLLAGLAVLKTDRRFRIYMGWQMLNGFATLMVETVLVVILADAMQSNWLEGGSAITAVPYLATGLTALFWAQAFDRYDIFTIRIYAGLTWAFSRAVLLIGVWQASIPIILLSRLISGSAMGGGQLAWRLGHMAFAPPEKDALYMGAHVSLTGLRGMVAPFAGLQLYRLLGANGHWLIGISLLAQLVAVYGFCRLRTKDPLHLEISRGAGRRPKNAGTTAAPMV